MPQYHVQIMLLFVYTSTHKRFVIFTCRYFKLSWNTTALSQSNCTNFSCSSIKCEILNSDMKALQATSSLILFIYNLIIGCSKKSRENYPSNLQVNNTKQPQICGKKKKASWARNRNTLNSPKTKHPLSPAVNTPAIS